MKEIPSVLPVQHNASASCEPKVAKPLKFLACSIVLIYTSVCFSLKLYPNRLAFVENLPPKIDETLIRDVIVVRTVGGIGKHAF